MVQPQRILNPAIVYLRVLSEDTETWVVQSSGPIYLLFNKMPSLYSLIFELTRVTPDYANPTIQACCFAYMGWKAFRECGPDL